MEHNLNDVSVVIKNKWMNVFGDVEATSDGTDVKGENFEKRICILRSNQTSVNFHDSVRRNIYSIE
jgi:hypothetical protein